MNRNMNRTERMCGVNEQQTTRHKRLTVVSQIIKNKKAVNRKQTNSTSTAKRVWFLLYSEILIDSSTCFLVKRSSPVLFCSVQFSCASFVILTVRRQSKFGLVSRADRVQNRSSATLKCTFILLRKTKTVHLKKAQKTQ